MSSNQFKPILPEVAAVDYANEIKDDKQNKIRLFVDCFKINYKENY